MKKTKIIAVAALILISAGILLYRSLVGNAASFTIQSDGDPAAESEGDLAAAGDALDFSDVGSASQEESDQIWCDIDGAVRNPGVYELPEGSRTFVLVEMAGGLLENADASTLNQAAVLSDGIKIIIPFKQDKQPVKILSSLNSSSSIASNGNGTAVGKVNINSANSEELQTLSGVGPATAQKIMDYRTKAGGFDKIEDIMNVSGIGEKTFEKLKDKITVN